MSSSSPLRLLPMPPEEMRGHSWVAQCNDERFTLHGERRDRCLPSSVGLADMPLHKVRSQMVCGACRARPPLRGRHRSRLSPRLGGMLLILILPLAAAAPRGSYKAF